jgi:indolepyruvate ferredoxin oxidoreductase alpha subunit
MLEPSDSQECKDFMLLAYDISEEYDTPVVVRLTTRIAHARTIVELGERRELPLKPYQKNFLKNVTMPANMRGRHKVVEARERRLAGDASRLPINRIEWADKKIGVVTGGAAYNYVKEAMPAASVLKLGLSFTRCPALNPRIAAGWNAHSSRI